MAIQGIVTNTALSNFILADNNEGFLIHPLTFSVSEITSSLDPTRTAPNGGVWFTAPISSRVVVDFNTVKFICTIPPASLPPATFKFIREIYIFGKDPFLVDFLMVIGQPSTAILYDPSGSVTLELEISLTNVDLSSVMVFDFTQATEVNEHNLDCNAHPELLAAVNKAGIILQSPCGIPFDYLGQSYDEKAEFEGAKATFTHGGVVWTATHNGTELNGITVTFDNIKTTDQIRAAFNAANPHNTIEHNDMTGLLVLSASVQTLIGGTYLVNDKDVVYRDVDGLYKQALANGTITSRVAGLADRTRRIVRSQGFITKTTGFAIGSQLFLSGSTPGAIVTSATAVQLGTQVGTGYILLGTQGGGGGAGSGTEFDAIVTDIPGFKHYTSTQAAIADVPDGGRILIDKLEYVSTTINPGLKRIDYWFTGPETGWSKYLGTAEKQKITFSAVPTTGTWRIEWDGFETTDLAFNATALDVENAINLLGNKFAAFSESFDDAYWTKTNGTVSPDVTTAYNGVSNADKFVESLTVGSSHISRSITPNVLAHTLSIYVKAGELTTFRMQDLTEPSSSKTFDVFNGVVTGSDSGTISNSTIEFITSGWYRCSVTWTPTTSAPHIISPMTVVGDLNDGFSGLYVWGAQLEEGVISSYAGPVTVTGDYTLGFEIEWASLVNIPQITFNYAGHDEIQQITFDNIPDNGTVQFEFDAQLSANLAWNDDAPQFETYLEAMSNISDVNITGSFATQQFTVQFSGVDGKTPKNQMTVNASTLMLGITNTNTTITELQNGKYPASNLFNGVTPIAIVVQTLVGGTPVGPGVAFQCGRDYTRFIGLGAIENFDIGIDFNGFIGTDVELVFNGVINPTKEIGLVPNVDFHVDKSFGLTRQRIRNVGTFGDHANLWDAVAAAGTGDKIVVYDDQTLLINQVINKDIEIEFVHGAQIDVPAYLSGNLILLGTKTKTKYMKLVISAAGAYDTLYLLDGSRGYHEDLTVESSNALVTVDHAFRLNTGATAVFCHGILSRGSSIINSGLTNDSGYGSHDVVIRDIEGGTLLNLVMAGNPIQEIPVGVVDGINDTFTLTITPASADNVLVIVDGVYRRKSTWTIVGNIITFLAGNIPQTGQQVDVFFLPQGSFFTPPRHLEIYDNLVSQLYNAKKINFGTALDVVVDSPEQVTISVSPGGGLGTYNSYIHTVTAPEITAKQLTLLTTPLVPSQVQVDVLQLGAKALTDDFTITTNIFDWTGLGLDGLLIAGHKIRFVYFS